MFWRRAVGDESAFGIAFIGELIAELLIEVVVAALSATVGVAIAGVAYALWLWTRRRVWNLTEPEVVRTPAGERFDIAVEGWRLSMPASERVLGVRRRRHRGDEHPGESTTGDALHPDRQLERFEGCLLVVAPFVLVFMVLVALLALLELLLVGLVVGLLAGVRLVLRRSWSVTVREGAIGWRHDATGLRAARRLHGELVAEIGGGAPQRARTGRRIE